MTRRPGDPAAVLSFQRPALFVQQPLVAAADEGQVGRRGLATSCPPDQVVPITPDRRPVTAVEDAVAIAGDQGPAGGRGDLPVGVASGLALKLRLTQQPADRRIACEPLRRLHGNRSDAGHLSGWRPLESQQYLGAGRDEQVRALAADSPELAAIERAPREVDQCVDASLTRRPVVGGRLWV